MDITHRTGAGALRPGTARRRACPDRSACAWLRAQLRQTGSAAPTGSTRPDAPACAALRADRQKPHARASRAGRGTVPPGCRRAAERCPGRRRRRSASGWSGSGPTISPSRCAAAQCAALAGAVRRRRRSARMSPAGSTTCCWRSCATRRCCSISTTPARSGPDSPAGQRGKRGLNENLARECMELHTVSPAAGYTQADVTEFRPDPDRLVDRSRRRSRRASASAPQRTSRASRRVMGRAFPPGEEGGRRGAALPRRPSGDAPLARHQAGAPLRRRRPAGGRVSGRSRAVLRDTSGDLGAAAARADRLEAAWQPDDQAAHAARSMWSPALRALEPAADHAASCSARSAVLGQPLWTAPQPNGWPDRAADWAGPEAMMRRIDWAYAVAGRVGGGGPGRSSPMPPWARCCGPPRRTAMRRAGSRREAVTLLLTSPEFQRR